MSLTLRITLLLTCSLVSLAAPAAAQAATLDPGGFRLQSPSLVVHENAGDAVITIERTETSREAQIRYITIGMSAVPHIDYTPVKGMLNFLPGQSSATFNVPIVDHGVPGLSKTIQVGLFGPSPIGLGTPSQAVLTILDDDPLNFVPNPANPLGLATAAATGNPLAGARLFVDPESEPAKAARHIRALRVIAKEPGTARFGTFSGPDAGMDVLHYLDRAAMQEPGTVPMLATYRILTGHCGHYADPPSEQAAYHRWITSFAQGIGDNRAVLFLEMDSLITVGCLSNHGVAVRTAELHDAINILTTNCPRLVIYLDAGAADAVGAGKIASLLRRAGVAEIQGFFLNATHFDWTSREIRYGDQISRKTGGKHFVVNTGENGRGPLVPQDRVQAGNEVLCNPPGRGLGPVPTTDTGYRYVDAFAWTSNPGESGGKCVPGAPATGSYWPAYARMLVHDAVFKVH